MSGLPGCSSLDVAFSLPLSVSGDGGVGGWCACLRPASLRGEEVDGSGSDGWRAADIEVTLSTSTASSSSRLRNMSAARCLKATFSAVGAETVAHLLKASSPPVEAKAELPNDPPVLWWPGGFEKHAVGESLANMAGGGAAETMAVDLCGG